MIGKTFGRWVVVAFGEPYVYPSGKKAARLVCKCFCGREKLVHKAHLLNGSSKSCGCLSREISTKHGKSGTRAYNAYRGMIHRVSSKRDKNLAYLENNIGVCPEWNDFNSFYKDMGDCPEGFELERLDIYGDYCKGNCIWASEQQQASNRGLFRNNTSGYTGVVWSEQHQKWRAILHFNKVKYEGGLYKTKEQAIEARKNLEIDVIGKLKQQ